MSSNIYVPTSIADINDNDNFHQLCFSTNDEIVKISMISKTMTQIYTAKLMLVLALLRQVSNEVFSKIIKFTKICFQSKFL